MFCRKCGKQIPDDSKFCQYCGIEVKFLNKNEKYQTQSNEQKIFSEIKKIFTKENTLETQLNDNTSLNCALELKKVGTIARVDFKRILESNCLSETIIEQLQNSKYCKKILNTNFPVLLKVNSETDYAKQIKDHLGYNRYYATPITIHSKQYFLTSQWYERSKEQLIKFIISTTNTN